MNSNTMNAVRAVLTTDPTLSKARREKALAAIADSLDGPASNPCEVSPSGPKVLGLGDAARHLSATKRTVGNLIRQGLLDKVVLPGRQRGLGVTLASLETLIKAGTVSAGKAV